MGRDRMLAGEFGAAARLSPKALRLYAEQGLLVPDGTDPATGYRHYSPQQLPRARLIGRLRALGLPLARIATLVELGPDARAIELRAWVRGQQRLLTERTALVETIERYADSTALSTTVVVREVPATKVLCRARDISAAELPDLIATAGRDIRAHLRAAGLPGDAPLRVQFQGLVSYDTEDTVEVAIAFDGHVEPVRDLYVRLAQAHRAAVIAVPPDHEDYPLILHVYDAIEQWASGTTAGSTAGSTAIAGLPYELHPGATGARFDVVYPIEEE